MQTHALQEDRAAENLNAWGVETFAPKYKERRSNAFTGRPVYFTRSLFPRYMFARFDAARMFRYQGHVTIERELLKKNG